MDRNELIDEKNWTIIGDEKLSFDPNAFVLEISIEKDDYYVGISGGNEDVFLLIGVMEHLVFLNLVLPLMNILSLEFI